MLAAQEPGRSAAGDEPLLGLLDAVVANCDAWRAADVLVRTTVSRDSTELSAEGVVSGDLLKADRVDRILFDLDQGRFAWFMVGVRSETGFGGIPAPDGNGLPEDSPEFQETTTVQQDGWICNPAPGRVARFAHGHPPTWWRRDRFPEPDGQMLQTIGFPDLRLIWLHRRLVPWGVEPMEAVAALRSGARLQSASSSGGQARLSWSVSGVEVPEEVREILQYMVFDDEQLVPVRAGLQVCLKDGRREPLDPAEIEWQDRNGIRLPVAIRTEQNRRAGVLHQDIELEWRSLNEPLDPKLFSIECLEDSDAITRMVDPDRKLRASPPAEDQSPTAIR